MTEDDAKKLARAFVDELLSRLGTPAPAATITTSTEEPTFMKVTTYARKRGFARSTIQQYLNDGMPSVAGRGGRRVDVRAADEWIRMGSAARGMHS